MFRMKKLAALLVSISALFMSATLPGWASEKGQVPADIVQLGKLVGGKWVSTIGEGQSKAIVEFQFRWHPDRKGIIGDGIIGKGSKSPVYARVTIGWDAKARKVYYLDTHNTDTIYYGHISKEGETFLYEFGEIGGDPKAFRSTDRFINRDLRESTILDKQGKTIVKFQAKRVK